MARRKIVLVIVEGPSDADSLELYFSKFFDMDGAFVDDSVIIEDETKDKFVYTLESVIVPNRQVAIERNEHKRENLNILSSRTSVMWNNIPYKIYYMSCNLDHVLHDKPNATDEEKKANSLDFTERYYDDINAFIKFISESTFSQCTDYKESWDYIKQDKHSLERNSNLGLCFI